MNDFSLSRHFAVVCLAASAMLAGCHKKVTAALPPPPPASPAPSPTAQISVSPAAISPGQTATLTWSTANATTAAITGLGTVASSGSRSITPSASTDYTLTARGAGGSAQQTARLTVNAPPLSAPVASMTEEQLFEKNMSDTYFDYDKYTLRPHGTTVAQQDAAFLGKHPDIKVLIAGHCDERGSEEYNIALGENRAQSLQKALVSAGVPASSIRVVSYGKEKPFCSESNDQCWQENRRDHISLDR